MAEQKKTSGSLALKAAPRLVTIPAAEQPEARKIRVAAYCRVSSDSLDQLNSFAAQNAYYTALIGANPDWELVDIYADRGITGTSADKRDDFQRLLSDCRRGLIDKVLVKSVTRFARNTKDFLKATRELKAIGVGVCFEEQNIDSSMVSGEMLASIFASLAQKESESISQNMRMSYKRRMECGTYLPNSLPYGYRLVGREVEIDHEKAKIIHRIFQDYLAGISMRAIADRLNSEQPACVSRRQWSASSISYILTNERYIGDSLWQKTYMTDEVPYKHRRNNGERAKYYAEETHPPIIEKDTFKLVQELIQKRQTQFSQDQPKHPYPLRKKVVCGHCGATYRRKVIRKITYWCCPTHDRDMAECPITQIAEGKIFSAFLHLYYKLQHQGRPVLEQLLLDLQTARSRRLLWSLYIVVLNNQIAETTRQERLLAVLKKQGAVDPDIFISRTDRLAEQLHAAKQAKSRLLDAEEDRTIAQTKELLDILDDAPDFLDAFDGELFGELVDKIIVESNERLRFCLINGLELTENIERTVR